MKAFGHAPLGFINLALKSDSTSVYGVRLGCEFGGGSELEVGNRGSRTSRNAS